MKELRYKKQTIFYKSAEQMDELDDGAIDAIITSPPYNVGKDYSANGQKYDDKQDYIDYLDSLERVFVECYRVASEKCLFFLNIGDSAKHQGKSEDVVRRAEKAGFTRLQTVIWVKSIFGKGHYTPSGRNRRLNNLWEYVFILYKTKKYKMQPKRIGIPYSDKSNVGRYSKVDRRDAGDIWFIPYTKTTGATIKKGHEAPFPVELPYRCLQLVKNPMTVLDPFTGTGSTLSAAQELGITGYGYEILPREDVIRGRLSEDVHVIKTPLLPQMEIYIDFLTEFVNKLIKDVPKVDISEILDDFNIVPRRHFAWACSDLQLSPEFVDLIKKNKKVFPPGKYDFDDS